MEVFEGAGGVIEWTIHRQAADGVYRRFRLAGLTLANPAGLRLTTDGSAIRLAGPSADATYHLELLQSGVGGQAVFHREAIPWVAGATHSVAPAWETVGEGPLAIGIDRDRDGSQDETLSLGNQAPSRALWAGWQPAVLELGVRLGPDGSPEFRILPADAGTVILEVSSNLRDWSPAGEAETGAWLPVAPRLPAGQSAAGPWFLRARQ